MKLKTLKEKMINPFEEKDWKMGTYKGKEVHDYFVFKRLDVIQAITELKEEIDEAKHPNVRKWVKYKIDKIIGDFEDD